MMLVIVGIIAFSAGWYLCSLEYGPYIKLGRMMGQTWVEMQKDGLDSEVMDAVNSFEDRLKQREHFKGTKQ